MQISKRILFLVIFQFSILYGANKYPIILIHGFLGWGKEELGDFNYWGGKNNIEQYLRDKGYEVYSVSLGPISSSYDCAVETFYQIKGGQLDYGQAHSEKYGIIQKPEGMVYPGLYPEWSADNPVHILGYSFGGVTSRRLLHLLTNTIPKDSTGAPEESVLLREKLSGWVASITTMSTPHNGATLSNIVVDLVPFTDNLLPLADLISSKYYDFNLKQWEITKKEDESIVEYLSRLKDHPAWKTKNSVAWDSSVQGAMALNNELTINPNVYYFSFSTVASIRDEKTGYHKPADFINRANYPLGWVIGRTKVDMGNGEKTDETWFKNDGTVNTISMIRPFTGQNGPEPLKHFIPGKPIKKGVWNFMGEYSTDHKGFVGIFINDQARIDEMMSRFESHAQRLYSLP